MAGAAVVLLQGYIRAASYTTSERARARSLSTGMPHLARVQSVRSEKPVSSTPATATAAGTPDTESYRTHTHHTSDGGHRSSTTTTTTATGKPVFDLYNGQRRRRSRRRQWRRLWWERLRRRRRASACVCQAPPPPPPRPSPVAPCHRQITRLVCSPRYRTRPS